MPVQVLPPSVVCTIEVHGGCPHGAVPSAQPSELLIQVSSTALKPAGTGPPAAPCPLGPEAVPPPEPELGPELGLELADGAGRLVEPLAVGAGGPLTDGAGVVWEAGGWRSERTSEVPTRTAASSTATTAAATAGSSQPRQLGPAGGPNPPSSTGMTSDGYCAEARIRSVKAGLAVTVRASAVISSRSSAAGSRSELIAGFRS
jgi:hypothetical protein